MFNCDKMEETNLTTNKVQNSFIYGPPFYAIVYTIYKLSNMVRFYGLN